MNSDEIAVEFYNAVYLLINLENLQCKFTKWLKNKQLKS